MGATAIRSAVAFPGLTLSVVITSSPDKEGRDAATFARLFEAVHEGVYIGTLVETRRPDDADAPARLLPTEVMAERDKIDEMVRVEVADDDRIERGRIECVRQPGEGSLAEIEKDARVTEPE